MDWGAELRANRISAFLSIKYWSTGAIVEYLSDCAAAIGARKPMLITSTRGMILITLSLVAALIAMFAADTVRSQTPSCAPDPKGSADPDLYCIELLPAGEIEGASGSARLMMTDIE